MDNWQKIKLGDHIKIITDYHANGAYKALKENINLKSEPDYALMIRTLNFEANEYTLKAIYLNEREYNYLSKSKVYPFDVIMNKIASPGSVYLMPDLNRPVSLAMNLFLIRFDDRLDQKFMFYLMKVNESYIKRFGSGTTTKTITKDAVRGLEFKVPKKNVQNKISSFIYALDKKIEVNNKINAELEKIAKTIYDYWFVQFDFPDENGKPYKSSGGKMVWNEELKRDIPEGWEVCRLGDNITFERGISYTKKTISEGNGSPMINLNSFYLDGRYKPDGIKHYNKDFKKSKEVAAGDLIIAVTDVTRNADIIGKSFILPDIFYEDKITFSMDTAKVVCSDKPSLNYLNFLFNSEDYHSYIKYFATGTLVLHLNLNGINWLRLAIPDKKLLDKFDELINPINNKIVRTLKENHKLGKLRDWLLPMLMNGQVEVKV